DYYCVVWHNNFWMF
nr:immunoglobulin light chain junction region [Macaca mulatta]MOY07309.1 immunoglobulin light chain junction region [Macaca mulatta]MOY07316.1 immunoglobulin light chain junction region [Macaca mulatta]MOY09334.1 immunoglobulin light chain junction region [Macaca mulatta]